MNWSSWSEFVAMGGYGLYVWGSFGATVLAVAVEITSLRARRKALRQTESREGHPGFTRSAHEG